MKSRMMIVAGTAALRILGTEEEEETDNSTRRELY